MKYQFDIKFAARKYTTQDGQEKTYWSPHGTVWIESDQPLDVKSLTIKIDSIPQSANWEGYFKAFAHRPKEDRQQNRGFPADDYEDVPF
jgi:hypothetical protein